MTKKQAAPIPVINGSEDTSREDQLRAWEEQQQRLRDQQGPPGGVPAPAFPNSALAPVTPAAPTPAASESASTAVATRQETPGYLPMPEFTEPASEDPLERLEHYSQGIHAVQYAARVNHERVEQQKLIALGRRLAAIKAEKLHIPAGFNTFGELVDDRYGFKKHHANNILRVLDVAIALEDLTTQELKERPLSVLVPVLQTHGVDAVRETWIEASRRGNITEKSLREAATFLGYAPPKEVTSHAQAETKKAAQPRQPLSGDYEAVLLKIRSLATQDQVQARAEAQELLKLTQQLLEELSAEVNGSEDLQ